MFFVKHLPDISIALYWNGNNVCRIHLNLVSKLQLWIYIYLSIYIIYTENYKVYKGKSFIKRVSFEALNLDKPENNLAYSDKFLPGCKKKN